MSGNRTSLEILNSVPYPGYLHGFQMPCVAVVVKISDHGDIDRELAAFIQRLTRQFRPMDDGIAARIPANCGEHSGRAVLALGVLAGWVQNVVGVPSIGTPHLFRMDADAAPVWRMFLPSLTPYAAYLALKAICNAMMSLPQTSDAEFADWVTALNAELGAFVPQGVNNREIVRAAIEIDIPVTPRAAGVWQYGYGHKARIFSSSLTERTPSVGVRLARLKSAANAFLKEAGIPVPRQIVVGNTQEAIAAAQEIGFPVVVKPADLDGGLAVSAGLETVARVETAYQRARAESPNVIVESCIPGQDYRINVFHDQIMLVIQRVPAHVVGDGKSTITDLVAVRNLDPRRRPEKWFQMNPIALDDEAIELLAEVGLTPDSVPENGRFVRLRRAANTSSGGETITRTAQIHPENAALARRAAKALRLDLAGIDLITKDIERPWYEDGGAICEVNAQVQFGFSDPTQYNRVISGVMDGDGRIPIAVVLTTPGRAAEFHRMADQCQNLDHPIGFRLPSGAYIGTSVLVAGGADAFWDVRTVLSNTEIGSAVVVLTNDDVLKTGLPFDRFDLLAVDLDPSELTPAMRRMLGFCSAHCAGQVLLSRGIGADAVPETARERAVLVERDELHSQLQGAFARLF